MGSNPSASLKINKKSKYLLMNSNHVETIYFNADMCKFESSQEESRALSADSLEVYSKTGAFNTLRAAWFRQFSPQKNSSFRLPYQRPSSFAHCVRELFSGSNGSASLVDCTRKKIFFLGGAFFLSDVISGEFFGHLGPLCLALGANH